LFLLKKLQHWRDSISRPIAPVSSAPGVKDTTRPRRKGIATYIEHYSKIVHYFYLIETSYPGRKLTPGIATSYQGCQMVYPKIPILLYFTYIEGLEKKLRVPFGIF
jgi:hypothetical protein